MDASAISQAEFEQAGSHFTMRFHSQILIGLCLFLVFLPSPYVLGDDDTKNSSEYNAYAKEEYNHIFRSIPVLFEHLLVALQDRPEVLENGNVMAFNDVYNKKRFENEQSKRSVKNAEQSQRKEDVDTKSFYAKEDNVFKFNDVKTLAANENDDKSSNNGNDAIDPDEVVEKTLLVQQKLEEYNDE